MHGTFPPFFLLTFSQWLILISVMCFLHNLLVHLSTETETALFWLRAEELTITGQSSPENASKIHKIFYSYSLRSTVKKENQAPKAWSGFVTYTTYRTTERILKWAVIYLITMVWGPELGFVFVRHATKATLASVVLGAGTRWFELTLCC